MLSYYVIHILYYFIEKRKLAPIFFHGFISRNKGHSKKALMCFQIIKKHIPSEAILGAMSKITCPSIGGFEFFCCKTNFIGSFLMLISK